MNSAIGLFGGTFDPIHYGHLRAAYEVHERFALQEIRFIPCYMPVLKKNPLANPQHRLAMLQLALQDLPFAKIDTRELERNTPSYTVTTLESLRQELPDQKLYFIIGSDAFAHFTSWRQWPRILALADILVLKRPGHPLMMPDIPSTAAKQIIVQEITGLEISSTQIRQLLAANQNPRFLLPDNVLNYIKTHHLY